ncbi:MAG: helix-turn-helix domain-containing protein [Minicystis sp.]
MSTNRIGPPNDDGNALGAFLRDRRGKLDPVALGYGARRRRTPGLRREEVAQRAQLSATWYTWLEQGRAGPPSTDVLERLSSALALTRAEREYLFLLAQNRPPAVDTDATSTITPALQRVLDRLELAPAILRTAEWDVLAWNRAAHAVLAGDDAGIHPPFNILESFFARPQSWAADAPAGDVARALVASFRADAQRAGFRPRAHENRRAARRLLRLLRRPLARARRQRRPRRHQDALRREPR